MLTALDRTVDLAEDRAFAIANLVFLANVYKFDHCVSTRFDAPRTTSRPSHVIARHTAQV